MQPAQGEFTDYKGMSQDKTQVEQFRERSIADPQMVDPDRGIGQDHTGARRRGGVLRSSRRSSSAIRAFSDAFSALSAPISAISSSPDGSPSASRIIGLLNRKPVRPSREIYRQFTSRSPKPGSNAYLNAPKVLRGIDEPPRRARRRARRKRRDRPQARRQTFLRRAIVRSGFFKSERRADHFAILVDRDFFKRTPGPPPFSSMNSTPADSRARCNFARASSETFGPNPPSRRLTVGSDRSAREANSDCDHPKRPRAARSCSIVITGQICLDPFWIIEYDPFWIINGGLCLGKRR
jgi:hypothetical protein